MTVERARELEMSIVGCTERKVSSDGKEDIYVGCLPEVCFALRELADIKSRIADERRKYEDDSETVDPKEIYWSELELLNRIENGVK